MLNKLPLNPNGKVDKPNLPFPDIAEHTEEASNEDLERWESLTETERLVATTWANLIRGLNAKTVAADSEFFNLGGHSILAQQMLLSIRKQTGANVSINALYEHPTLGGFSTEVDRQLGRAKAGNGANAADEFSYSKSLDELLLQLSSSYKTADAASIRARSTPTVFLTGSTGFLGAFLIRDLLERTSRKIKLIAHVRAKDPKSGLERLRRSLLSYGLWKDEWSSRLTAVVGDLSKPQLGIDQHTWNNLAQEVDIVVHNGATVHWVRRYQDMMATNVLSTLDALKLCNEGKPKIFTFISSTSVLDSDHYIRLSEEAIRTGQRSISEEDDLEGSRVGLGTGYGQSKWVSEQLVRAAGKRGLLGSVVRPGYILGDSQTGTVNTDE